jgi:hypothetical protein
MKYYRLYITFLVSFIAGCALEKDKVPDLICSIAPVNLNQPHIQMTVTNQSQSDIAVLSWYTPFEGFLSHMFDVAHNGSLQAYQGPMVKRSTPRQEDYFILRSGAARTININLGLLYDFSQPGEYEIQYRKQISARFLNKPEIKSTAAGPQELTQEPAQDRAKANKPLKHPIIEKCESIQIQISN